MKGLKYVVVHSLLTAVIGVSLTVAYGWYADKQCEQREASLQSYLDSRLGQVVNEWQVNCYSEDTQEAFIATYVSTYRQSMAYETGLCISVAKEIMLEQHAEDERIAAEEAL